MTSSRNIRLLVLDVDGVLTDGRLYYGADGDTLKTFHTHDGYGIKQAMRAGIEVAVISGRPSPAASVRLRELGVRHVILECANKAPAITELQRALGVEPQATAVVGDDVPDLAMMEHAGLRIAVADAHRRVREVADWITSKKGGRGAVREVCDALTGDES